MILRRIKQNQPFVDIIPLLKLGSFLPKCLEEPHVLQQLLLVYTRELIGLVEKKKSPVQSFINYVVKMLLRQIQITRLLLFRIWL